MATPIPTNQARFTLSDVAAATGGSVRGHSAQDATRLEVVGVCTDTRAIEPGSVYVALRGELHDGHRFVAQAFARGAAAAIVARGVALEGELSAGAALIEVDDTLTALGDLAALHRKRWGGRVIGVTGSAGKTTTKELIYAAFKALGARVVRTAGNLNNLVGMPMTVLALDASVELAVLEMGTSTRGEIARLAAIAQPNTGVVTSVAAAHAAGLGSVAGVAEEKAALLWAVPSNGSAIAWADEPLLLAQLGRVQAQQQLTFGTSEHADVRLVRHAIDSESAMTCEITFRSAPTQRARLRLFGPGPALDAAAALAVVFAERGAEALPVALAGLASVEPVPGRLEPLKGPHGAVVLDDSYNANPASMRVSIAAARELAAVRGGRLLLVLGEMRELGALSQVEHENVGKLAVEAGTALFVACGAEMARAASAARREAEARGIALDVAHTDDIRYAAELVLERVGPEDVVLIKGSRGMRMERVVEVLAPRVHRDAHGTAAGAE
jgi:UDP-N-acetylmuramoyl-tripeptide--D-alanyl-D-alanine ligase